MPGIDAHPRIFLFLLAALLTTLVWFFDKNYSLLRDESNALKRSYSFSRVQLAWWTIIVLSSFITILFAKGEAPDFYESTLILLGISCATTAAARFIDVSDTADPKKADSMIQTWESDGFWRDILSDANGVSVHRFQTVVLNVAIGLWFIVKVLLDFSNNPDSIMPELSENTLILLGLSSGTYAVLKLGENKTTSKEKKDQATTAGS